MRNSLEIQDEKNILVKRNLDILAAAKREERELTEEEDNEFTSNEEKVKELDKEAEELEKELENKEEKECEKENDKKTEQVEDSLYRVRQKFGKESIKRGRIL